MSDTKRTLLGLFRSHSRMGKEKEPERPTRSSDSIVPPRKPRAKVRRRPGTSPPGTSQRSQRASIVPTIPNDGNDDQIVEVEWPPPGLSREDNLTEERARELICPGATIYKGRQVPIPHASERYYALYSLCEGSQNHKSDCAPFYPKAFRAVTYRQIGRGVAALPWETLEQPSMAFCYGARPGTVTLNYWASLSGKLKPEIELVDPHINPREIPLSGIMDRLIYLQEGLEEDNKELMYQNLYTKLLRDPDKQKRPHKAMELQITDLIVVLSSPQWIDFSKPENHVVAKFFHDDTEVGRERYKAFFHQLLLSMELHARISSKNHLDSAKEQLIPQIPPKIAWTVAVARKWQERVKIGRARRGQIKLCLRHKQLQIKGLRSFIRLMKWPNIKEVDSVLKERDSSAPPLEELSPDSMSYFSGVILPGTSLPFLLMTALIDCDPEASANLGALTHMYPNSGFQYRSSTYWSSSCIVGKVLAPTCKELGGWIGPGRPTPDLSTHQVARVRQRPTRQSLRPQDVHSMYERSDPLGSFASEYPVDDYQIVLPDMEALDVVRVEMLSLTPVIPMAANMAQLYDASIRFAIKGQSWTLRLAFDVCFVCAYPCTLGPHPLFEDYSYHSVKIDELLAIKDWGKPTAVAPNTSASAINEAQDVDVDRVLVVEAFGAPDNEVLARAHCSHWGLGAVVANVNRTCMACAVREAYAACLTVVILVKDDRNESQPT